MDIDEKVSALYKIRRLDKEEYVLIFDKLIQEIFTDPKPEYVIKLCAVFYDEVYFHEVMYGLIHAIEALAKGENYSCLISLGICNMAEGRDWSKIFIYGILNTKDELMKYPKVLRQLSEEQRRYIVGILQEIKKEDEKKFGERIFWILSEVNG
ncbi:Imm30 family immunity protein [Selenomonas ruminantium]|uniref:Immunity protein 30 n=1 Tax=Selenomonas ruminantium TaxID=971 RepID=A0A1I0V6Z7_SELRU|nr:Imm30 family immunity protein [Selenomonas ruminantium]SFA72058.1 Immunity protein 30 [Selenomonas ruminantium]